MNFKHVSGENRGKIKLYALSTCGWCAKTKKLLNQLGVRYYYLDVDHLKGKERENAIEEIKRWNPLCTLPTLVINDESCIVGFKESEIKEALDT